MRALLALTLMCAARLTEAMAGIEIWSGCGLVLGPPIGGTIYPSFGVPGVFLTLSIFPAVMLLTVPGLK
jgi:MFS family permease